MTLVELMAVTAIIGIVALLASVGYSRFTRSARMTEATDMVSSIKMAQENYFTQTNKYLNVSNDVKPPAMYPMQTPNNGQRADWGPPCTWCNTDWTRLGIKASGKMSFGYATVADSEACDPDCHGAAFSIKGTALVWKTMASGGVIDKPWYIVTAVSDFNGDGKYTSVVGTSFSSRVISDEEP
jgi:type II secretory pathway pseudopilin PulG